MGCEIAVAGADDETFGAIVALFEERDRRFSRFRPDSELSRVNAAGCSVVAVSPDFARAVRAALAAARASDGLVDPTVGAAIGAVGYDDDFALLRPSSRAIASTAPPGWRALRLGGRFVGRPAGCALDLRGRKGNDGRRRGRSPPGGRVRFRGRRHRRAGSVVVGLPDGEAVTLAAGGMATSGSATRRWRRAGAWQHHLIDPRTGLPSKSPWLYVTAVGRDCLAVIAAKAGFLLGDDVRSGRRARRGGSLRDGRRRHRGERLLEPFARARDRMHLTSSPLVWELARASGVVAYLLLTVVVVVGIALAGKVRLGVWPRFAVEDVHRFGGLLIGVFVSLHVLAIAADSYVPFSLGQLVVPGTSAYRPLWTALGIVAAELLVALAITNKLRKRVPYRVWRTAHYLNFVVWIAATGHGVAGGSDGRTPWLFFLYLLGATSVLAALARRTARRVPVVAAAAAAGAAAVVLVAAAPHGSSGTAHAATAPQSLSDSFSATIDPNGDLVSVVGSGARTKLRVDLALGDESVTQGAVQVEDVGTGAICSGDVATIDNAGLTASCTFGDGSARGRRSLDRRRPARERAADLSS